MRGRLERGCWKGNTWYKGEEILRDRRIWDKWGTEDVGRYGRLCAWESVDYEPWWLLDQSLLENSYAGRGWQSIAVQTKLSSRLLWLRWPYSLLSKQDYFSEYWYYSINNKAGATGVNQDDCGRTKSYGHTNHDRSVYWRYCILKSSFWLGKKRIHYSDCHES